MSADLASLVASIARRLVEHPEAVEVHVREGTPVLYELRVAPEDQGRIIGREGRTIRSLRLVVGAAARKMGERAAVEILD